MRRRTPKLQIRVTLGGVDKLGPGKITLLEALERTGSITAAGRAMDMSYRRAWVLIDTLNRVFKQPVVEASAGGSHGGGARLTPFGRELVALYRSMERAAETALKPQLTALGKALLPLRPKTVKRLARRRPPAKWG